MLLPQRDVHVWQLDLSGLSAGSVELDVTLSTDEVSRAAQFRFERDRRHFAGTRAALRRLLGSYLGIEARNVEFAYGEKGKPRLAGGQPLHFNVSHSADMALFAFTWNCEIGIDVEATRPLADLTAIAQRFFCAEECQELKSLDESIRARAFFQCWTRKEAYIKAIGEGLSAQLDQFRVTLRPEDPARLVHIHHDIQEAAAWTLHSLDLHLDYAGAVAYRDQARHLQVFTCPLD